MEAMVLERSGTGGGLVGRSWSSDVRGRAEVCVGVSRSGRKIRDSYVRRRLESGGGGTDLKEGIKGRRSRVVYE